MKKVLALSLLSLLIPAVLQATTEVKLLDQRHLLLSGGKRVGYSHQLTGCLAEEGPDVECLSSLVYSYISHKSTG